MATPAETAGVSTVNGLHLQTSLTALPAVKGLPARLTNHRAAFTAATTPDATSLVRYDAARRALAEADRVDQAKDIRDKATAMEVYTYQAKDPELMRFATEIKRRATRRIGELIEEDRKAGKLAKGAREPGTKRGSTRVTQKPASLADQGVDKNLASQARKMAAMPEAKFEAETAKAGDIAVAAALGDKEVVKTARAERHGAPTSTPFAGRSAATTRAARLGQSARRARSPRRGGGGHDHYHRETQCPSGDEPNGH